MNRKKICIIGAQGVGKTTICNGVIINLMQKLVNNYQLDGGISYSLESCCNNINKYYNLALIPEQFREVVKDIQNFTKQTEEITLATYAKQLYLENLYTAQGKNILCDRSVLDTFIYYTYYYNQIVDRYAFYSKKGFRYCNIKDINAANISFNDYHRNRLLDYDRKTPCPNTTIYTYYNKEVLLKYCKTYSKIYLIAPSDREIENDGFRLTDKKQQLEIHKLFLEYFKDFDNVEIINQEEAHKEEFVDKVVSEFVL